MMAWRWILSGVKALRSLGERDLAAMRPDVKAGEQVSPGQVLAPGGHIENVQTLPWRQDVGQR
jgi:hypothetical protein